MQAGAAPAEKVLLYKNNNRKYCLGLSKNDRLFLCLYFGNSRNKKTHHYDELCSWFWVKTTLQDINKIQSFILKKFASNR